MKIKWLEIALTDLKSLHQYISQDKPIVANQVAKRILKTIDLLPLHPGMGRPGRVISTRELVISRTPFIIPYRVKKNSIEILRVFHAASEWPDDL